MQFSSAMDALRPTRRSEPGIVAVSGGADSTALARLLVEAGGSFAFAHVNHRLRGDESDGDEAFVIELGARLNVPVHTASLDPHPDGGNLEAACRRLRYEWLRSLGGAWIATAHTLDDQAETILHRMIRGTGLQGLRGIACRAGSRERPESSFSLRALTQPGSTALTRSDSTILRPLLSFHRSELREYLHYLDQPFCVDSSNADPRFTRNRIRHQLLPLLETFNPRIAEVLSRLGMQANELFAEAEADAAVLLTQVELPRAGAMLVFDATKLEALAEAQRRSVLRFAWQREDWPEQGMTFAHWRRLAALESADFPGGVSLRRSDRIVQLGPRS